MELNKYIDHTLLKADASEKQIQKLCEEARKYDFASVCVNTSRAEMCRKLLEGTDVNVCCVVGFPLGAMTSAAKAYEALQALRAGAGEVDMVINIGFAKDHRWDRVEEDIREVTEAVRKEKKDAVVKSIIETCLLTDEEKVQACLAAKRAGADFVKTSTGFSTAGAKAEDVALMKKAVGDSMKVKASGGIHTLAECEAMIRAGADRIGASAGVAIMEEYRKKCAGK